MATYTQIAYHLIFSTKERRPVLQSVEARERLFRYIWGFLKNNRCHLYRINGVEDHVHILTGLHPSKSLSDLMHDLKLATSAHIKAENLFPRFTHWQEGYGAFTVGWPERDGIIEYIKNQVEHHKGISFRDEYVQLLERFGVEYEEKYLD